MRKIIDVLNSKKPIHSPAQVLLPPATKSAISSEGVWMPLRIEVVPLNLDVSINLQINLAFLQWDKTPRIPQL